MRPLSASFALVGELSETQWYDLGFVSQSSLLARLRPCAEGFRKGLLTKGLCAGQPEGGRKMGVGVSAW